MTRDKLRRRELSKGRQRRPDLLEKTRITTERRKLVEELQRDFYQDVLKEFWNTTDSEIKTSNSNFILYIIIILYYLFISKFGD